MTEKALRNELNHFDVDMDMFPHAVSFVARIIKVGVEGASRGCSSAVTMVLCLFGGR